MTGMVSARGSGPIDDQVTRWLMTSELDRLCPAMWARLTFVPKFCRLPVIFRSDGRDQNLRNKLRLARVLTSKIRPCKGF